MDKRHRELVEQGNKLFSNRLDLDSLWQEVALNFYPEMAVFTSDRSLGADFAEHLTTSFPLIARRTLGDALAALLRPVSLDTTSPGVWFSITAGVEDNDAKRWLEWATGVQRRAMYDRASNFVRATKEGDHSFATFGQTVISVELNRNHDGLLYRSHHLKDVVWTENAEGQINLVQRRWKPTVSQLVEVFGSRASARVKELLTQDPFAKVNTRHIVIDREAFEQRDAAGRKFRTPWVSIWVDVDNDHVMEEIGSFSRIYVIPRWVTVPGSQYASSPAVTSALPDARLVQAMTLTLLEAGEKFANPPIVATQEAIRSDLGLFAGGVTWVDAEYDERLGDALRPLFQPTGGQGVSVGLSLRSETQEAIAKAFFLDSLSLPPASAREMTAFEVGQRISEWIRRAMPIFEPMEFEYNGALCEETFDLLMRNGGFGSLLNIPHSLRGADIRFKFESPLHESSERRKGQKFLEAKAALVQAAEVEPGSINILDAREALRDVFDGIGVPAKWTRSSEDAAQLEEAQRKQQAMQQVLAQGAQGAAAVKDLGSAVKDFSGAQATGV